ncbi:DUF3450 domain-containing protein [Pseudobacteriovorax antillogorgiicola]|uniref:DUF3450 domain-containing protein n=1 Tax=Pseudobacteriovorax antillogorgiicola TaxID=1513793 RepID=A0A1Y6BMX6_9BACT|nr:DUF3450 domain-containing protein [Pseudobacteriovorax antillogorgiicola]TCS53923.1 uncharacterized protein DUF3450 [Pseudobacteriovorax antillogorgiicola]SMF20550.1 Protein of unknown function [Pseudobacteriovorax antillogorgiicola]
MAHKLSQKVTRYCLPAVLGLSLTQASFGDAVKKSVDVQTTTVAQNKTSQKNIDGMADKTSRLLDEYRLVVSETESLRTYNDQLEKLIKSQNEEVGSIQKQIDSIEVTNKEVVPLMIKMIDGLEQFVELDVPFLMEERKNRIQTLREMMDRADVSTSEKYRRVLEAYQVENEYGRSIEAYSATVDVDGEKKTVDFLRIGRVVLIYQTLDGKTAMIWNKTNRKWEELGSQYASSIKQGLKIAKKQSAPDLLTLPVPAPEAN